MVLCYLSFISVNNMKKIKETLNNFINIYDGTSGQNKRTPPCASITRSTVYTVIYMYNVKP